MQVHFQRANGYEDSDEDGDNFLRVMMRMRNLMMMMMKMRNLISHRNEKRAVWLRVGDAFWVCPESDNYIATVMLVSNHRRATVAAFEGQILVGLTCDRIMLMQFGESP